MHIRFPALDIMSRELAEEAPWRLSSYRQTSFVHSCLHLLSLNAQENLEEDMPAYTLTERQLVHESHLLVLKILPSAVIHKAKLAPQRCQPPVGVVRPQQQAVLGAARQHPVGLPQILHHSACCHGAWKRPAESSFCNSLSAAA